MGFLTKLEKLSEKYIEGFFKTRFANHIQPVDIAKLLLREMRDNKTVSVSKVYVPNEYTVFLGQEDWPTVDSVHLSLSKELQEFLKQKADDRKYEVVGEFRVYFLLAEDLPLGRILVKSAFSEELPPVDEQSNPAEPIPAEYTLVADRGRFYNQIQETPGEDTLTRVTASGQIPEAMLILKIGTREGMRFPLGKREVVIGRRRSGDICLEDTNVSRVHASVDYFEGSYFITDLGSTNGTFVNEVRVNKKKLAEGDLIRIGTTILEFKVV